jgi:hypothetical protein
MRVHGLMQTRWGKRGLLLALPVAAIGTAATTSSAQSDVHTAAAEVTNPFFPLKRGSVYRYSSPGKKTVTKVLKTKKTVQGRRSTVVDSKEYEGGKLTEHFVDYYFQGSNGNVYYMKHKSRRKGESWTAGKSGAKRGIIMPAHPKVGRKFKVTQAGGAGSQKGGAGQDRARVYSVSKTRVKIKYTSRYYPETVRYIYKRGVGLYKILDKGETTTLTSFKKP